MGDLQNVICSAFRLARRPVRLYNSSRVFFPLLRRFRYRKKIQPIMCAVKMGGDQTALTGTVSGHLYSWNVGAPSSYIVPPEKNKTPSKYELP